MTPVNRCACGRTPHLSMLPNSRFRLRALICECGEAGPCRMDNDGAIAEWNKGRRVLPEGGIREPGEAA